LSLSLAKLASSTSPQKPPATYTRVNDFGPHTDSIFRGRLIREYIWYYVHSLKGSPNIINPNRTKHVHTTTVCKTLPVNTHQITDLKFEHKASM